MSVFDGLDDIFVDTFGEDDPVTIYPEGANPYDVKGIFTEQWRSDDVGDFGVFDGSESSVDIKDADLPDHPKRAKVAVRGNSYRVVGVRPDEQGMTTLILQRDGLAPARVTGGAP